MAATDRSFAEVLQDIVGNGRELVRSEVRFAKSEVWEEVTRMKASSLITASGALTAVFAFLFLLLAASNLLSQWVPNWAANLIVGCVLAATASLMLSTGISRFRALYTSPNITIETNKENSEWAKQQIK